MSATIKTLASVTPLSAARVGGKAVAKTAAAPLQALEGLRLCVQAWQEHAKVREVEVTKRETIRAERDIHIEHIRSETLKFRHYLDRTYDERSQVFDRWFKVLDQGIATSNQEAINAALHGIGQQIEQNPLQHYVRSTMARFEQAKPGDIIDI